MIERYNFWYMRHYKSVFRILFLCIRIRRFEEKRIRENTKSVIVCWNIWYSCDFGWFLWEFFMILADFFMILADFLLPVSISWNGSGRLKGNGFIRFRMWIRYKYGLYSGLQERRKRDEKEGRDWWEKSEPQHNQPQPQKQHNYQVIWLLINAKKKFDSCNFFFIGRKKYSFAKYSLRKFKAFSSRLVPNIRPF